jgi:RimJ/RimL family protein N-acetyltransferase
MEKEDFLVRRMTPSDLDNIAKLYTENFPEHILVHRGILNNFTYLEGKINDPDQVWAVGEHDERMVGVAALAIFPPIGSAEIERVCVEKSFRGNGVARGICSYFVDLARQLGLGYIEAFARGNEPAMQRTLEKLGFQVYGISPKFEVMHGDKVVREEFVNMGLLLKPEILDTDEMDLIPDAKKVYTFLHKKRKKKK